MSSYAASVATCLQHAAEEADALELALPGLDAEESERRRAEHRHDARTSVVQGLRCLVRWMHEPSAPRRPRQLTLLEVGGGRSVNAAEPARSPTKQGEETDRQTERFARDHERNRVETNDGGGA